LAVLGLGGFALLTWAVASRATIPFDQSLLDLARSWNAFAGAWELLSNAANIPMIFVGVGLVLWLFWKGARREAVLVVVTLALVTAGSEGVKQLVHRPRPPGSDTVVPGVIYSYPSGHVLEAVTILGIIAVLVWRGSLPLLARVAVALAIAVFVGLVGVARVAINAHYPSDILAGLLAGIGVVALFILLTRPPPEGHPRPSR
jgi:undecaprenyl-diphosphatase